MPKINLPTYAIVELLIRLVKHDADIGDYKNHTIYDAGVIVRTTSGSIRFSHALVTKQFESPELISDAELADTALLFKMVR